MSYWSKRQEKLNKALEKDEETLKKRLNRIYEEEARRLQKEIAAYYEMYGEEDVIEYRKLLEELSAEDRRLLIEDMEEFARKYPEHKHLLPVRESIYKLDRLQGLQESVRLQQMRIGAQEEELIREHLVRTAYRGANASAEAMGFGSAFYSMNEDIVKKFVDVPWSDGKSFSERIWENKEKLTNFLNKDIAQGMARGDSYANLTKHLMERMGDVSRRDAYRLIYTEGTYVHAEASITPFEEDFEYYKLSTVGDRKVCSICKGLEDAEPVPISKRVPGENFPPLHPWCRCTFTIEVEDWDAWMDDYVAKHGQTAEDEAISVEQSLSDEDIAPLSNRHFKQKNNRSKRKLEEALKEIEEFLPEYIDRPSKWSGRVRVVSRFKDRKTNGLKNWNCDISVKRNVSDCTLIHEMIHSTSASYYSDNEYKAHQIMEEASVELMTRAICKDRKIPYEKAYSGYVNGLVAIGKYLGYTSDMDFAKELMKQPMVNRNAWLMREVDEKLKSDGIQDAEDYGKVIDFVLGLEGPIPNV